MNSVEQQSELNAEDAVMASRLAAGESATQVAAGFNISVSTMYRKLRDPAFKARVVQTRLDSLSPSTATLLSEVPRSIAKLVALRDDPASHPSTQLRAAVAIIELSSSFVKNLEVVPLIEQLIEVLQNRTNP